MNNIKYANFLLIIELTKNPYDIKKEVIGDVFAGMYTLTLLTKDGFTGLEELRKEQELDELKQIKKDIKRTLQEQAEKNRIKQIVKNALKTSSKD